MRLHLTCILLFSVLLQVSFASNAQTISFTKKNASLSEIFKEIKKQSQYDFLYSSEELSKSKRIDIKVHNLSLTEVLTKCFNEQPFTYSIKNKTIIVVPVKTNPNQAIRSPSIDVKGRVVNEKGEPLSGATVRTKNANLGTNTDSKGQFYLKDLDPKTVIIVSYLGYVPKEISITADLGTIILEVNNSGLNEIQIIGYGTTTQRLSTGSIATVNADEIARQPVSNPLQALQGNVAGMFINQSNGLPGASVNISIRGQNSIGAGNNPLYIIDGVPFNATPINQQSGSSYTIAANGETSPFNSINPTDIESISILKDADATAIYGSRAANGVVLITTKKGKAGKAKINVNVYSGIGNVASKLKLLNTDEYLQLRRQAFNNDGIVPDETNAPDLTLWGAQNRDLQEILIGNTSHVTEASTSVSGGENNTTFFLSGTYRQEGSVYPKSKGYKRGSALLNINHTSTDKKFNAAASVSLSKDFNELSPQDISFAALTLAPNYPLFNGDGSYFWDNNFTNPLAMNSNPYQSKTDNILTNMNLGYHILPGLVIKTSLGYNKMSTDQKQADLKGNSGPNRYETLSILQYDFTEGFIVEPQLNYDKTFGKSKVQFILGGTYQSSISEKPYFTGLMGFSSDKLAFNLASAQEVIWLESASSEYKYASVFGRVNYQLNERYIFNISGRRDGSSRFGPNNKFGNFGAIGAAWIFSEENFIKKHLSWLSFGKLRSSYGTVGNDQINDYGYLSTYQSNNYRYGSTPGIYPVRIANPDYSWESTQKIEVAVDLGFLNDRILLSAAVFRNRTDNMLVNSPLSPQTGFSSFQANLPALVQNTGLELELHTTNIESKNLSWKSTFNLTIPRNKLISFPGIENSTYANTYVIGKPLSMLNMYHVEGIKNGIVQIMDANGDGEISTGIAANGLGDFVSAGQLAPKLYGGFSNNFKYNNWQLDVFLQFVSQKNYSNRYASTTPPGSIGNQDANILNLGLKPTATFGTEAYDSYILYSKSDQVISNASYIRFKNISLSYSLPKKWTKNLKIDRCNLYMRGQNLFTITNYQGLDPETNNEFGPVVPPLRLYTMGIQCSL